jgi:protein-S-isoprenylcysteine O-methyltransferase Ste14
MKSFPFILRFFVIAVFYMTISFQIIAWKYQTKDVYFKFRKFGRLLLVAMHVSIVLSNVIVFLIFINLDRHPPFSVVQLYVGMLLLLLGLLLFFWGVLVLRLMIFVPQETDILIIVGPFRLVRHPMYLGGILAAFGLSITEGSMLGLVYSLILTLLLADIATHEERDLIDRFGQQYLDYKEQVARLNPIITLVKKIRFSR